MNADVNGNPDFPNPEPPRDYSFEGLFRFAVDKEKSGFDQCRNQVMGWLDKKLEDLGPREDYDDEWSGGKRQAYTNLLEYLKGAERGGPAARPDVPH